MIASSHATSGLLEALLFGPVTIGSVSGPASMTFGRYVVAITQSSQPRLPNGIECELKLTLRGRAAIGRGRIEVGGIEVEPGPGWDPVPPPAGAGSLPPGPEPAPQPLAALGMQVPSGLELIAGYVAGLVLLHRQRDRAVRIARRLAEQADAWNATLLGHASGGEVPEAIHTLFSTGDPRQLLKSDRLSGHAWLRGLVSAGLLLETWPAAVASVSRVTTRGTSHG